jgi:hypothetical protein
MASHENQSGNVIPFKTVPIPVFSKAFTNLSLFGFTAEGKSIDANLNLQIERKSLPKLWEKNDYFWFNADETEARVANELGPDFDLCCQKVDAVPDGTLVNHLFPISKEILLSPVWKNLPVEFVPNTDAVNPISQFIFDGESISDESDLE